MASMISFIRRVCGLNSGSSAWTSILLAGCLLTACRDDLPSGPLRSDVTKKAPDGTWFRLEYAGTFGQAGYDLQVAADGHYHLLLNSARQDTYDEKLTPSQLLALRQIINAFPYKKISELPNAQASCPTEQGITRMRFHEGAMQTLLTYDHGCSPFYGQARLQRFERDVEAIIVPLQNIHNPARLVETESPDIWLDYEQHGPHHPSFHVKVADNGNIWGSPQRKESPQQLNLDQLAKLRQLVANLRFGEYANHALPCNLWATDGYYTLITLHHHDKIETISHDHSCTGFKGEAGLLQFERDAESILAPDSAEGSRAGITVTPDCRPKLARDHWGDPGDAPLKVVLDFVVGSNGHPKSATVATSSCNAKFDAAALKSLSLCKFRPGYRNMATAEAPLHLQYIGNEE